MEKSRDYKHASTHWLKQKKKRKTTDKGLDGDPARVRTAPPAIADSIARSIFVLLEAANECAPFFRVVIEMRKHKKAATWASIERKGCFFTKN